MYITRCDAPGARGVLRSPLGQETHVGFGHAFFNSSYSTSTKAPPAPRSTLEPAPLKKARLPSSAAIFRHASTVPV